MESKYSNDKSSLLKEHVTDMAPLESNFLTKDIGNSGGEGNANNMHEMTSISESFHRSDGIMSLLSAIEQTGDSVQPQFGNNVKRAEFGSFESVCIICGMNNNSSEVVFHNILTEHMSKSQIELKKKIMTILENLAVLPLSSNWVCNVCFKLLQQVEKLEDELEDIYKLIKQKYLSNISSNGGEIKVPNYIFYINNKNEDFNNLPPDSELEQDNDNCQENISSQEVEHIEKSVQKSKSQLRMKSKSKRTSATPVLKSEKSKGKPVKNEKGGFRSCSLCNFSAKYAAQIKRHMLKHTGEKPYECETCGKKFSLKSNMLAHWRSHSSNRPFSCNLCSKSFKQLHSLNTHISTFHKKLKEICKVCKMTFRSKHLLQVHERVHTGARGFVCDVCGEEYQTKQALKSHTSVHTGVFKYSCEVCVKGFNSLALLSEHKYIHTGEQPYSCKLCDKKFSNRGSLWAHAKRHENAQPYSCDKCSKKFSHSSHLAVHKRTHSGVKPYSCDYCTQNFVSSHLMKRHQVQAHSIDFIYVCPECGKHCGENSKLEEHCKKFHKTKYLDLTKKDSKSQSLVNSYTEIQVSKNNGDKNVLQKGDDIESMIHYPKENINFSLKIPSVSLRQKHTNSDSGTNHATSTGIDSHQPAMSIQENVEHLEENSHQQFVEISEQMLDEAGAGDLSHMSHTIVLHHMPNVTQ